MPLVIRDIDLRFTSYFVAKADSPAKSINYFAGESFAFGSRESTSGHLTPRHFLAAQDITKEFFRDVRSSGAHDATAYWVSDGTVTIGVLNAHIFRMMLDGLRLKTDAQSAPAVGSAIVTSCCGPSSKPRPGSNSGEGGQIRLRVVVLPSKRVS